MDLTKKTNINLEDGISIVMPALNEERNISPSIEMIQELMNDLKINYQLIIINDGSSDNTKKIATSYEQNNNNIILINNKLPEGMGSCYKKGLEYANKKFYMHIVSKNECDKDSIKKLIESRFKADIIIPYTSNMNERDSFRKYLSYFFTVIINFLNGLNIRYYNGTVIYRTHILKSIKFNSSYHTFQCEALLRLIKKKYTYIQLPVIVNWNKSHKTSAFKASNFKSVFKLILNIILKKYD